MSESNSGNRFMTVRQVAEYLQLNEIKCARNKRKNTRDKSYWEMDVPT